VCLQLLASILTELKPDMQAQFEDIFRELGAAAAVPDAAAGSGPSAESSSRAAPGANAEESFQETIRRTMERMQTSGNQATAAAAAEGSDDLMEVLMRQMQAGGLDGEGNEEDFTKMLMGMMDQLTNKEILYEPMKELSGKFPAWIEENRAKTSAEDMKRYEEQSKLADEIVAKFEDPSFSDSNPADRQYIMDKMQKVSDAGVEVSKSAGFLTRNRCKSLDHHHPIS
jgi:peroxin-19